MKRVRQWLAKASLVIGSIGLSALAGFLASLLRRRPVTSYTTSHRQPRPSEDEQASSDAIPPEAAPTARAR
jgi:hypothetical protein